MALERLGGVDWPALTHAYGSAADVPNLIRLLTSDSEEARKSARWHLYGNIFHQGTRYQATPYSVPFLLELAGCANLAERDKIVDLLVFIALGYPERFLPNGINPLQFRKQRCAADADMTTEQRDYCKRYGSGPLIDIACYDAVLNGVPLFVSLLEAPEIELRCSCTHALAWFPERTAQSTAPLSQMIVKERSEREMMHALLAVGLLANNSHEIINRQNLLKYLRDSQTLPIRTAAAIAVCGSSPSGEVVEILIDAVSNGDQLKHAAENLLFNDGNLIGLASLVLSTAAHESQPRIVEALCRALKAVEQFQSLDVTRALLDLVTDASDGRGSFFKGRRAGGLTIPQNAALRGILDYGAWQVRNAVFANYGSLVASYGLPSTRDGLREYLDAT